MFDLKPDGSFIRVCGGKVVIKNKYQISLPYNDIRTELSRKGGFESRS